MKNSNPRPPKSAPILSKPALKSGANLIASAPPWLQKTFLKTLDDDTLGMLPYLFDFWALPHQIPPAGNWGTWVVMGGRGAGKTRAGAEWVRRQVEGARPTSRGAKRRIGLIAETYEQAREIMVFGESGILAVSPPEHRPVWIAGRRMLEWPNGATAQVFSAHDHEALRGPQFDAVWVDEFAKWRKAEDTWDMVQFCLQLGDAPQACVTTTPRNTVALRALLDRPTTVMTHAATQVNRMNLAADFMTEIEARYAGTRLGRQEIDGEMLTDVSGALWSYAQLSAAQVEAAPKMDRIIVAIDPPVTSHAGSDECGILVCGVTCDGPPDQDQWTVTVLEDAKMTAASPVAWAQAAVDAMAGHDGDRLVVEVNQGGDMVETILRQIAPLVPFRAVHATKGKVARAEPVAALYEQGRVKHLRGLSQLEDQMCQMTVGGFEGRGSPDRVDALVWAIQDL